MNIKIIAKSNNLYCRITSGRAIDVTKKLGISIETKYWDHKNQKIKNAYNLGSKDVINAKLHQLKAKITDKYNTDYINGEIIDGVWLQEVINICFGRTDIKNQRKESWKIYFLDFCYYYLENETAKINHTAKKQYSTFIGVHLTGFLKSTKNVQIKIKDISHKTIENFVDFMQNSKYSYESTKRHVNRFKFFLHRAENFNLEVNKNYKEKIIVKKNSKDSDLEIYLNESEIERIFNLDLTGKIQIDNVRDNFIIGLCTGLRVSDFNNNLKQENIIDGFIEIKTKKTGTKVAIPLHKFVVDILNKRNGNLPTKINDVRFNIIIKKICKMAKINELVPGNLFDAKTKRNALGTYEKYKLVSSHICRRSFATNLFGKVPNHVIQAVGGWTTESMMLHYIKKSSREQGEELKKYWDNNNNNNNNNNNKIK